MHIHRKKAAVTASICVCVSMGLCADVNVAAASTQPSLASRVVITSHQVKNKLDNIMYAQVSGLPDTKVEQSINAMLTVSPKRLKLMNPNDIYTGSYQLLYQAGNLLELEYDGYDYPQGAAHGEPSRDIKLINLATGQTYDIADLFKAKSGYLQTISQQVKKEDRQSVLNPDFSGVKASDGFALTRGGVQIFFQPYEWAPYAAGMPEFNIAFRAVESDINKRGSLWKSIENPSTQHDDAIQNSDVAKIKSLGFQPYAVTPTDTQQLQGFAAGNVFGQTLYAFVASKGTDDQGNIFFFVGRHYLGTDTLNEHDLNLSMHPDGRGTIAVNYQNDQPNGGSAPFTIKFTWTGAKLKLSRGFPENFS